MLRFFRHIREKLYNEKKFSRYLLYALGEIALVVIGILIAILINNWNNNNQSRKILAKQLLALQEENRFNISEVEGKINYNHNIQAAIIELLKNTGKDYLEKDERHIDSLFYASLTVSTIDTRAVAIENIVKSNQKNLIKNDSLQTCLMGWHAQLEDIKSSEDATLNVFKNVVLPHFYENFSMAKMDRRFDENLNFGPSAFEVDNRVKLNELKTENILEDQYYNIENVLRRYTSFLKTLQRIDSLLIRTLEK